MIRLLRFLPDTLFSVVILQFKRLFAQYGMGGEQSGPALDCWGLTVFNLLKPTGHVMHQQFNIQQLCVLPTLYLCVLYLSENKQRLVPLTA